MNFLQLPFFTELEKAKTILLAGAGGGFDIFSGLPLYFGLRSAGKTVYLANLSFSHLEAATGKRLAPAAPGNHRRFSRGRWIFPGILPLSMVSPTRRRGADFLLRKGWLQAVARRLSSSRRASSSRCRCFD